MSPGLRALLVAGACACAIQPHFASAETMKETVMTTATAVERYVDEAQIRQLSVDYALATDAVGRGATADARAIYRRTFLADAPVMVAGDEKSLRRGPDGWADYVESVFRDNGYDATQHLIGTIDVQLDGSDRARMSSYLHATHRIAASKALSVVLGTYVDEVVRTPDGWRIARRTLSVLTSWTGRPPP